MNQEPKPETLHVFIYQKKFNYLLNHVRQLFILAPYLGMEISFNGKGSAFFSPEENKLTIKPSPEFDNAPFVAVSGDLVRLEHGQKWLALFNLTTGASVILCGAEAPCENN